MGFYFDLFDFNGDGTLQIDEMTELVKCVIKSEGLECKEEEIDLLVHELIRVSDEDKDGEVGREEFVKHQEAIVRELYHI
jgi:Ca2+-binding EF-hand superfamily protein